MRFFCALFIYLFFLKGFSQTPAQTYLNSLEYEQLLDLFNEYENDSLSQEKIARTYLERAKRENDTIKIARGYDRLARAFSPLTNIKYADSLIEYTKGWEHIYFSSLGYILKGYEYSRIDDVRNTIENYLIADSIADLYKNLDFKVYVLDGLVNEYLYFDNTKKALEYQNIRHKLILKNEYYQSLLLSTRNEKKAIINNLYQQRKIESYEKYVLCYIIDNKIDSSKYYIQLLENEFDTYDEYNKSKDYLLMLLEAKMEVEYFSKKYDISKKLSDSIFKMIEIRSYLHKYKNLNLFKGLSFLKKNDFESAEKYLLIADSIYNENPSMSLMFYDRMLFNGLHEIYKELKILDKQIVYLNKLLYLDSLGRAHSQYFFPEMNYKFEKPILLKEKEQVISALKNSNEKSHILLKISLITLGIASLIAAYFYRRQRLYKKRFLSLLKFNEKETLQVSSEKNSMEGISDEIVKDIQNKLAAFEKSKGFLKKDITLQNLAKAFDTNSNYLSRVLNSTTQKNFSQYLNELRINYAVEAIRFNPEFKKYTIDAIAKECGYNSGTSFSRVFYKQTGIYPSYYIENLSKITPELAKPL
ncbi:MAG: helix-turn-helix domain-containing protein [Flavobacteriaceae bacterium]